MTTHNTQDKNQNKGFASMDAEKQREIASKGGKASHQHSASSHSSESSSKGKHSPSHSNK